MPQVVDDTALLLECFSQRIADLETRVAVLESSRTVSPTQPAAVQNADPIASPSTGHIAMRSPASVVPILGKAILAMAGAYLLRAVAESGTIAQFPMVVAAIAYAGLWMAWAVRAHRKDHFASATYGITATLILTPLLYESTVRFHLLSVKSTSTVLVAFVVLVLVLAWRSNLQVLPWVGSLASIATLWALILATHELVPLTCALLAVAFAAEVAACLGHRLSLRPLVAIAADAAVTLFIYVMTAPEGVPSSYIPASPTSTAVLAVTLLIIYGGSIGICSFGGRKRISNFEILQGILALTVSYVGVTRASHAAAPLIGILFLVLSFACYWGMLSRFAGDLHFRNRVISSTWAVMLMIAGTAIVFSPVVGAVCSCILAVASQLLHRRNHSISLAVHTALYLALAAVLSPALDYVRETFTGTIPTAPHWTVWVVLLSAIICYSIAPSAPRKRPNRRLLWIFPAALAAGLTAALTVVVLHALVATRFELAASHIAGIRTAVTCAVALTLAFLANRLKHPELGWLAYAVVGLGALKLLLEDLRFGNARSLVVSFLFYGLILIFLPRSLRPGHSQADSPRSS